MKLFGKLALATLMTVTAATGAFAETHEVKMYTKNPENAKESNVFIPNFLVVKPGDVVKFITVDKGHNAASSKGMLPEGVTKWKSKISKDYELTLEKPGVYGYACQPHNALGMVGMIVVEGEGMLGNLEDVKKAKIRGKKAKKTFASLIEQAEALKK